MVHDPAHSKLRHRAKAPTPAELTEMRAQMHDLFRLTGDNMEAIAQLRKAVDDLKAAGPLKRPRPVVLRKVTE
jgi:hypothetical protein